MRVQTLAAWAVSPVVAELALSSGPNPVQRVTKLLNKMKSELEEEAKADEKLYKDLQCWCKTNNKDKEAAIASGKTKAKNLEANIKKYAGSSGEYKASMEIAQEAVKKAEKKLDDETASHESSIKGLREDETDLVATVNALANAINILGKHNLMQKKPALIQSVSSVLHFASQKSKIMHGSSPTLQNSFLQSAKGADAALSKALADDYAPLLTFDESARTLSQFVQFKQPTHLGPHQSQSSGIFGILQQMKENFNGDLADTRTQIEEEVAGFKKMKSSLQTELKTQRKASDDAKANYGKAMFYSSEGKEELQKTRDTAAADTKVLSAVKSKCQSIDKDMGLRTKARADEMEAVDTAIGIMTSDENRSALGFSFTQTSSRAQSRRERQIRKQAADVLATAASNVAKSWGSFTASDISTLNQQQISKQRRQLMFAAQSAKLDAFTKVKELIDKMVADIKAQMADDVKQRDQCTADIQANKKSTRDAERLKTVTESNIEGLNAEIEELGANIKKAYDDIAEQKTSIKKASEEREEENKNFQTNVQEQRDMYAVLQKAHTVLKTHYEKAALIQKSNHRIALAQQTPMPGEFTPFKANDGSNAVLVMFEKIMGDAKSEEAEALSEEAKSQAEYEEFVADSNAAIESLASEIASMGEEKAAKTKSLSEETTTLKDTEAEIENLGQVNGALHGSCDFLIKFFSVRQEAMSNEITACQKAKAILTGSK